jgi:purine-binding chemotaxis protein CheW
VQEIVQLPEQIVQVPHSEAHVLGVMTLRKRLLPLVSLRRMFGLPDRAADENSRIVVVSLGNAAVGVVMDSVNEVLRVARSAVDAMPGLLARDGDMCEISQICRLNDGKRMVSILSVGQLFRHSAVKAALSQVDSMHEQTSGAPAQQEAQRDDEEQVVVFLLGKEEFGVPIESVQEIVRVAEQLTRVPKAPPAVEGVINLRGAVLPVLDLRRRLGLAQVERSDRQRIMVFLIDGARTGFIVDSVVEVLKIHKSDIEDAPRLSGEPSGLLARMANLEKQKRMVQLLAPAHLFETQDRADLAALAQLTAA